MGARPPCRVTARAGGRPITSPIRRGLQPGRRDAGLLPGYRGPAIQPGASLRPSICLPKGVRLGTTWGQRLVQRPLGHTSFVRLDVPAGRHMPRHHSRPSVSPAAKPRRDSRPKAGNAPSAPPSFTLRSKRPPGEHMPRRRRNPCASRRRETSPQPAPPAFTRLRRPWACLGTPPSPGGAARAHGLRPRNACWAAISPASRAASSMAMSRPCTSAAIPATSFSCVGPSRRGLPRSCQRRS